MTDLLDTLLVPIADPADARQTARAIAPYLEPDTELLVAHVVPEGEGGPDRDAVEQREAYAGEAYETFMAELPDDVAMSPVTLYGRDVGETIVEGARESDATAIAYTPRGLSGWLQFLTGSVADDILENGELPVLVVPEVDDEE